MREGLAERLMHAGLLTPAQLNQVRAKLGAREPELAEILVQNGLDESALAGYYVAEGYGPLLNTDDLTRADERLRNKLPHAVALRLKALPVRNSSAGVIVAMATPSDLSALVELERHLGPVMPTVARISDLHAMLESAQSAAGSAQSVQTAQAYVVTAANVSASAAAQSIIPLVRQKQATGTAHSTATFGTPSTPQAFAQGKPAEETKGSHVRQAAVAKLHIDETQIQSALHQLGKERNRDRIVELACKHALLIGNAAIFLALGKTAISGWSGAGEHVSIDAVRALRIPRASQSMVRRVLEENKAYAGPYGTAPVDQLLHSAAGRQANAVYVTPVRVRSAVIGFLCVDCVVINEQATYWIERLVERIGSALEQAILAKKRTS